MANKSNLGIDTRELFFFIFFLRAKTNGRSIYTFSVFIPLCFQVGAIFEWFLAISIHPKAEEGGCLKVKGCRPLWRNHLGLHSIPKSFLCHVVHQVWQAAPCKNCWRYHRPTVDELYVQNNNQQLFLFTIQNVKHERTLHWVRGVKLIDARTTFLPSTNYTLDIYSMSQTTSLSLKIIHFHKYFKLS